jgi:hypothetical protein
VNPNGIECNDHNECGSEYCDRDTKLCTARKAVGESCSLKNECESYICDNSKCSDQPQMKVQPTPTITNDAGKQCSAEINYPNYKDYKGLLSDCKNVEKTDDSDCYFNQNICQDGKCRVRFKYYCYPGNNLLSCLNVC